MRSQRISQFYLHTPRSSAAAGIIPAFAYPAEAGTHLPTPEGWKLSWPWTVFVRGERTWRTVGRRSSLVVCQRTSRRHSWKNSLLIMAQYVACFTLSRLTVDVCMVLIQKVFAYKSCNMNRYAWMLRCGMNLECRLPLITLCRELMLWFVLFGKPYFIGSVIYRFLALTSKFSNSGVMTSRNFTSVENHE